MFDELELLLKQAKKERHLRRTSSPAPVKKIEIKRQAEMEWTQGQTVCLIHRAADGTETALGLFVEWTRAGSRWLRPTTETLSPHHSEIVTGSWWLNPNIREIPFEDSPAEVAAIRARFEALLAEFSSEYPPEPSSIFASESPKVDEDDDEWDEDDDEDYGDGGFPEIDDEDEEDEE